MPPGKPIRQERLRAFIMWGAANTEKVANILRGLVNADIIEIEPATPFPDLAYRRPMTQWVKEQQEKKNYPMIKPIGVDIASYDFIIIGTPSWYNTLVTPIVTLLQQTDFRGKPVTVFGTHQGNGRKILGDFAALAKNARIVRAEECERAVLDAIEAGYRSIDTAQAYGNEDGAGNVVRKYGVPRSCSFPWRRFMYKISYSYI
jgi:flavodoxin